MNLALYPSRVRSSDLLERRPIRSRAETRMTSQNNSALTATLKRRIKVLIVDSEIPVRHSALSTNSPDTILPGIRSTNCDPQRKEPSCDEANRGHRNQLATPKDSTSVKQSHGAEK